jgi:opacity protein-like surface antigen
MTAKCYLLAALLVLSSAALQAQTTAPQTLLKPTVDNSLGQQTVYLGVMGSGIMLSAHYDIRFQPNQLGWGIHAGVGYAPTLDDYTIYSYVDAEGNYQYTQRRNPAKLTIPFGLSYLMGKADRPHRLELGIGATYMNGDAELFDDVTSVNTWLLVATIGYRRYYFGNRLMWKIAFTPVVSLEGKGIPVPYAEGGIGVRF